MSLNIKTLERMDLEQIWKYPVDKKVHQVIVKTSSVYNELNFILDSEFVLWLRSTLKIKVANQ